MDGIALVPSEHVLLLPLHLPLASARRRREAVPFAMEEYLSEPLESLHFVLGDAVGPQLYLAAAVGKDRMRAWIAALDALGAPGAALVPDVLTLPVPEPGQWCIFTEGSRALVRLPDGGGFATRLDQLAAFWRSAGRPAGRAPAEAILPNEMPVTRVPLAPLDLASLGRPPIDLRQGEFARSALAQGNRPADGAAAPIAGYWRRAALITAGGLAAHGAIAAADTLALSALARHVRAETQVLVGMARPRGTPTGDLAETAAALLPDAERGPAPFLPLLSAVASVMSDDSAAMPLASLDWSADDKALRFRVGAADAQSVNAAASRLRAQGLTASVKPSVSPLGDGAEIVVR